MAQITCRLIFLACAFAVGGCASSNENIECPVGTTSAGETTPEVREAWCELERNGTVVQHGPYRAWWPNGKLGSSGQYSYGQPVGKWTGWFPSGTIQGEEWFEDGTLVKSRYYTEQGEEVSERVPPNQSLHRSPDAPVTRLASATRAPAAGAGELRR